MKPAPRWLARVSLGLLGTLLLTEASLQIVHGLRARLAATPLARVNAFLESDWSWERHFINNERRGIGVYEGLHTSHPTRGWAPIPGLRARRGDITYTTNGDGLRSLHELTDIPDRYQVIVLGDSFTFGDDIDDSETWPHLLAQQDRRLNVLNLAGTGYGIDQMYITLRESIAKYQPRLVIAPFISEDLQRSLLTFRDFKKPRFVLRNDELVLTNTPIGSSHEVEAEIRREKTVDLSAIQIVNAARVVAWRFNAWRASCGPDGECTRLNGRLFEAMRQTSDQHQSDFLMMYLPFGQDLVDPRFTRDGEAFFNRYRDQHPDQYLFNPRPELLAASFPKSPGHYAEPETSRVAALVYREIRRLPSWKAFVTP